MTGERPTVTDDSAVPQVTDPAVEAVLRLLTSASTADLPVEARYDVLRKFGNTRVDAVIARDRDRWSLTVDRIRFLDIAGRRTTCDLPSGRCTDDFDEARVSDALTTVRFSRESAATRLRRDAGTATGPAVASSEDIAGHTATCALLPQPGGNSLYCASEFGILALQDTADVRVSLEEIDRLVDPSLFDTTSPPR